MSKPWWPMTREVNNIGASVRARLLARARTENQDFQILLMRYALERLLYRLSVSDKRDDFILKGAMLFAVWRDDPFRPTRDLDLLGRGDPAPTEIAASIRTICATAVPEDGVVFDVDAIRSRPRAKASGKPASMAARNGSIGARSTSAWTNKRWRPGLSKSPEARSATHRYCPICSARFPLTWKSDRLPRTAPTTRASAMMPLQTAADTP